MSLRAGLEVLFLGPREWRPLVTVPGLWKVEALLWGHYLFRFMPLDIWLQARILERPFDDFRFGETPWFTGLSILREAGVGPDDHLVDLGCGRGKLVFLTRLATRAQATGVELLPGYVYIARRIASWLGIEVSFLQTDFTQLDLSSASVVYVAGSEFAQQTVDELAQRISDLEPGSQWISVARAWDYPALQLESQNEYLFSWGRETVYRYRVVRS